ncbi:hypothetical protein [Streptomyces sp. YS415]|uniref:hypothetical protein n=1 Tax=Streptomyces sp. YS415 TaxID=2944806 RepID=UPI002021E8CC|nr:hypothetical protein [Streptomyces sp. YS415]MCL7429033.1 hypothetical protein [Streptomyces sp. YS415]
MGEQLSDGGTAGRRPVLPHGTPSGPPADTGRPGLEALLAAAMRPAAVDAEGERRAVAAFRAAREAGVHRARTRRRDDWRPRTRGHTLRSLRATLSLFAASLALGGAAFAAIGTAGSSSDASDGHGTPTPSTAPADPDPEPSAPASGTATAVRERPSTAADTEAKCRAYEQLEGNGKALDAPAWQRLTEAAGGAEKVAAYCAQRLAEAAAGGKPEAEKENGAGTGSGSGTGGGADNGAGAGTDNGAGTGTDNGSGTGAGNGSGAGNDSNTGKPGKKN